MIETMYNVWIYVTYMTLAFNQYIVDATNNALLL